MTEFRISEKTVAERQKRNERIVFVTALSLFLYLAWEKLPDAEWLLGIIISSGMLARMPNAYTRYPWATMLEEESQWVLRSGASSLHFQHLGKVISEINGCDVKTITVERRYDEVFTIDIAYNDQRTRLKYYDRMDELLDFILNISPDAEVVQVK